MSADFDIAAAAYDQTFSDTTIGRMQRDRVWGYLQKQLAFHRPMRILELNGGTGEDALFFAKAGHQVVLTDISKKMLDICQWKIEKAGLQQQIKVQSLDMKQLSTWEGEEKFDLIFSNFGGLNCLRPEELAQVVAASKLHLKSGGRFIGVIMPDFCLMESVFFLLKLEFKQIFRRRTNTYVVANVDGIGVKTWYYSPQKMRAILRDFAAETHTMPIGFLPSYLENGLRKNAIFMNIATFIDTFLSWTKWSAAADHFIINATKKP